MNLFKYNDALIHFLVLYAYSLIFVYEISLKSSSIIVLRPLTAAFSTDEKRDRFCAVPQRYTYRVLQTIQMKPILLCVWPEPAVLGSTTTALKFKYEI